MKTRSAIALLSVPVAFAAIVAFHPGVAYAGSTLQSLTPAKRVGLTGNLTVDPMHTFVGFDISHLGLSRVQGRFDKLSGKIHADDANLANTTVEFTANTDSVDTNVAPRDADLRSKNFFDVEQYPQLTFKSTSIRKRGNGFVANGQLSFHGVTKPVSFTYKQYGPIKDPWGGTRVGVVADPFVIKRSDFGMNYDADSIGDEVAVHVSLEATVDKQG